MRIMVTIFVVVCTLAILASVGGQHGSRLREPITFILPFLGGHPPGIYDAAGCLVIIWTCVGIGRLLNPRSDTDDEDEYEEVQPEPEVECEDESEREQERQEEDDT